MAKSEGFFQGLIKGGVQNALLDLLGRAFTYGLPFVVSAVTLASGWLGHIVLPWPYLITAAAVAFAATATGLLRFAEWRARHSLEGKLSVGRVAIAFDLGGAAKAKTIKRAQVQLFMSNHSLYPISYVVEEISSSISARVNPSPKVGGLGGVVPIDSVGLFRDDLIEMGNVPAGELVEGKTKFKIRYGKLNKEKYVLEGAWALGAPYDVAGRSYPVTTMANSTGG